MPDKEYSCDYTVAFDFFKLSEEFDEMKKICVPVLASKPQGILDVKAAKAAFSEFLQAELESNQIHYIQTII